MSKISTWPAGSTYRREGNRLTLDKEAVREARSNYYWLRKSGLSASKARMTVVHLMWAGFRYAERGVREALRQ